MIKESIKKLEKKEDLTNDEMKSVFTEIMDGVAAKEDIKRFLSTLSSKGETVNEIVSAATILRERALKVVTGIDDLVDTCGTGGATIKDVNISTIASFVLAGLGVKIAKHGNRSFTGKSGSADLLASLGIKIEKSPEEVANIIRSIGIGFIFAPLFHPAMRNVKDARKELAAKTIFNLIGPLSNPANPKMQLLGVFSADLTEKIAESLKILGSKRAYVVHGLLGIDEISIKGATKISQLEDGAIKTYQVSPLDFGIREGRINDIAGSEPDYNAKITMEILNGKKEEKLNTIRNMVLINTSAVLRMIGRADDFKSGVEMAAESIDSGQALEKLEALRELSNK